MLEYCLVYDGKARLFFLTGIFIFSLSIFWLYNMKMGRGRVSMKSDSLIRIDQAAQKELDNMRRVVLC